MGIPLLETKYVTRPHRVASIPQMGFEDEPIAFNRYDMKDEREFQNFVYAAYRQILGEQLILESNRQVGLESQLRNGAISVQDFVRGMGKSEVYRRLILEPNSNYRFVEITLKRFLGREPYSKQETIKWAIVIGEKGYHAFIDAVVDSAEYAEAFGADTLPYQLRPLSQPYNLVTPSHAADWLSRQTDQRRPGEAYSGPMVGFGAAVAAVSAAPSYTASSTYVAPTYASGAGYTEYSSYNPDDVAKGLIPLLDTKYVTRPHRVASVPQMEGEDKPLSFNRYDMKDEREFQNFVYAAYRQIFAEQLIIDSNRQLNLESQLRNGAISVQDFVRGLGKSDVFRRLVLEPNNNYRFVDVCLKRFLGRESYSKQETIKLSIIIAQKGYHAFIDALVDSEEYREAFGSDTLPYQLRPLSQPYNLITPRFGADWLSRQLDQRRSSDFYAGPMVGFGTAGATANISIPTYGTTREPVPYKQSSSYNPADVAKGLLPLLDTKYATRPHRVASVPQMAGEDKPLSFNRYDMKDEQEFQNFIYAAYRQIFSEHLFIDSNRQTDLESQLRNGAISVQDFVRGLGKSDVYRRLVLEPNNNYRFVEVSLKRFLGREPYGKQETIKYSIIIAQKGYLAFIDALVDSDEYRETFGSDTLPYQLRQLSQPYNLTTPRFDYEWRSKQPDQLRPGQRYSGPIVLIGWRAAVENYTIREEVKAGDKAAFLEMAQAVAPGGYGQAVSAWNIKLPDMTNDRTPELVGSRRASSPSPAKR
jgi:phycobilisome rod-core linker protein